MEFLLSVLACLAVLTRTTSAADPIEVREQEFVDSQSGERFMIIGVDYQPGGQGAYGTNSGDPLSNGTLCLRDAALMQNIGINTIRSYNVDPTLNHDECVSIFNSVGIYMILDVNAPTPGQSLDRSDPSGSYNTAYLRHIFSVVEAFKSYPNTLGFFAGNEIINAASNAESTPRYIRAVQRDLKNYIANNAQRHIPVGYSAADVADLLQDTWAYLQCNISSGSGVNSRSDFFGLNDYSWCGPDSSFTTSGYDTLVQMFGNTTIPVFFSEYGCNMPEPRYFDEVPVLYGPMMTTLSGGLVYEWTEEADNFGLVTTYSNGTAQLLRDYNTLQSQYAKLNISLIESANSTATSLEPPQCNANLITGGDFSTNFDIPDTPSGADALISSGVPNPPSGSIVSVTATSVPVAVYATNGAQLKSLSIRPGSDQANHPGSSLATATASGSGSGSGSGSSSASASSSTSKSDAAAAARAHLLDPSTSFNALVAAAVAAAAVPVLAYIL